MPGPLPTVSFTEDNIPHWCCPACLNASLEIVPGSFQTRSSAYSLQNRDEDWYGINDDEVVFTCMLLCSRRSCQESVAVSGSGRGEEEPDVWQEKMVQYMLYRAHSFVPPLPVFTIPESCPGDIAWRLRKISALLPVSDGAAVNAIRITLEMVLDKEGVPRETAGDKPQRIPLAKRIELNKEKLGSHYEAFHALKDFGNHGSHTDGPIRRSDIEGACQVLDDLIQRLYGKVADYSRIVARLTSRYGKKPRDT
ncbi:MAG: DUF4145 domain-containing protein [Pantoea sp.]|uniref:DUF4145 domain-containing protein n=1 Tax=Erwiniaceae TaxID=1903409 RepID=UPI0028981E87|nr:MULTISPECIES: DUF4145 domain-containing protein [Pantoea]MDU5836275.1 DUF4145 domain-containing protein [Pantoea sp.]MDU6438371.1 DUF4145 domain-containing protein [Pantoea sp.]